MGHSSKITQFLKDHPDLQKTINKFSIRLDPSKKKI